MLAIVDCYHRYSDSNYFAQNPSCSDLSNLVSMVKWRLLLWKEAWDDIYIYINCHLIQVRRACGGLLEVRKPNSYCGVAAVETKKSVPQSHHRSQTQAALPPLGQRSHAAANLKGNRRQKLGNVHLAQIHQCLERGSTPESKLGPCPTWITKRMR